VAGRWGDIGGAQTPEELETLLEDALVIGNAAALAALFEEGAALGTPHAPPARGSESIVRLALVTWGGAHPYVAHPRHVIQTRDVALVVGEPGINVARRGVAGIWRYAIVFQTAGDTSRIPSP
jgi:hypothetical protein